MGHPLDNLIMKGKKFDAYNPTMTASPRTQFASPQNPAIQYVLNAPIELSSTGDATHVEGTLLDINILIDRLKRLQSRKSSEA